MMFLTTLAAALAWDKDPAMWAMFLMPGLLFGYLLGSIPFGLLLTRAAGLGDVRKIGSGNIGATNVLRTGNKGLAAATLLLDGLKGTAAVVLVHTLLRGPAAELEALGYAAGLGAFIGHLFPVWLKFKGGKGVATFIGVLAGAHWPAALAFCAVWLGVAALTRLSSLAALVATAVAVIFFTVLGVPGIAAVGIMGLLIVYAHRANIARLLDGTEPKIGAKT
jgi:acyl phosphate:glycerol-3-phosphate acyltransferase